MRGTVGISGGREVEEGYEWRVKLGLLYYILKSIDRVIHLLTRVKLMKWVPGLGSGWVVVLGFVYWIGLWWFITWTRMWTWTRDAFSDKLQGSKV